MEHSHTAHPDGQVHIIGETRAKSEASAAAEMAECNAEARGHTKITEAGAPTEIVGCNIEASAPTERVECNAEVSDDICECSANPETIVRLVVDDTSSGVVRESADGQYARLDTNGCSFDG